MRYSLRCRLLIFVLQQLFYLCVELRILRLKLHQSRSSGTGPLYNTNIEDLIGLGLRFLEQLLQRHASAVSGALRSTRRAGHCRSTRHSRSSTALRSTGSCWILRHIGCLHLFHIKLSSSDTLRTSRRKNAGGHLHFLFYCLRFHGVFYVLRLLFLDLGLLFLEVQPYSFEHCILGDHTGAGHIKNGTLVHVVLDERSPVERNMDLVEHMGLAYLVGRPL